MFEQFFKPFVEYKRSSTLSADELKERLHRECAVNFFSLKYIKASFNTQGYTLFHLRQKKQHMILRPIGRDRNTLRALLNCSIQDNETHDGSTLHIVLKPENYRWYCWFILIFLAFITTAIILVKNYVMLWAPFVMFLFFWTVLYVCRTMAEDEIPQIRQSFDDLILRLEAEASAEKRIASRQNTP